MRASKVILSARVAIVLTIFFVAPVFAADWPMWRNDANRSGASATPLPKELHLQWIRELPTPVLAWPREPRLHFDASYEPVAAGKSLFVGSPNDGSVAAYDTDTGKLKWRFYTGGPVRFAPVAWEGQLFVASDDGRLYCLDAGTGSPKWTFRAAPPDRPDLRHLGNGRLVSFWPVRGGPVLRDGKIYFASGIWPTMGVFVYALDARTGKALWCNKSLNWIARVRVDHNQLADAGLSPQGYLLLEGARLLVPNGRSMPAGLDYRSGRLLYYIQGYRNGDCRVTAEGEHVFVGNKAVVDIKTGREMGSLWAQAGDKAPKNFGGDYNLFEGPYFPYKLAPGCNARSVLGRGEAYGSERGVFYAYDLKRAKRSTYKKKWRGRTVDVGKWDAPQVWKVPTKRAGKKTSSRALALAGRRLYGHAGKTLVALDLPAGKTAPTIAWQKDLPGTPASIIAADRKLFVATAEGHILCYGARETKPVTHKLNPAPLPDVNDQWTRKAQAVLKASGVSQGYCLVLGLKTGRLVEELLKKSEFKIIGIDPDREKIDALRGKLAQAGLYGGRAELFAGDPISFELPPYIASVVVSETMDAADFTAATSADRLFRILRPYGGVSCLAHAGDKETFKAWVARARLEEAVASYAGDFAMLRRAGALPGAAPWTHETVDAGRSYCSKDKRVKAPLGILWYGDGADYGFYKHHDYGNGVKPQVVGGVLLAYQVFSKTLHAVDVYTGRLLWKTPVRSGYTRFASMEDGIYVASGGMCIVHEGATGKILKRFEFDPGFEGGAKGFVSDIRVAGQVVVIGVWPRNTRREIYEGLWDSAVLVALDRTSGKQLWRKEAAERFSNNAFAIAGGLVFCADSPAPRANYKAKLRGQPANTRGSVIMALDAGTGKTIWQREHALNVKAYLAKSGGHWLPMRERDDWVAYSDQCQILLAGRNKHVYALNPQTGKLLWSKAIEGPQPMVLRGKTFVHQHGLVFDIQTGKQLKHDSYFHTSSGGLRGCNYGVGGEHLFFLRQISALYIDAETNTKYYLRNIRSGCSHSMLAADGVLAVPNFAYGCVCNYPLQTAFTMVHMPITEQWAGAKAVVEAYTRQATRKSPSAGRKE